MEQTTHLKTVAILLAIYLIANFILIPVVLAIGLKYTRWKEHKRRAKRKTPLATPPHHFNCRCKVVSIRASKALASQAPQLN